MNANVTEELIANETADAVDDSIGSELEQFRFYTQGVLVTPVSVFGIIGNILSVFVLSCPEMRSNFNQLLIALSVFDLLYLVMSLSIFAIPLLSTWYTMTIYPIIMPIGYGFAHIGRVGSVFITLSVTIERFFAITYPLKKLDLKRWLIFCSVSGAVLYNLPRFFELRMVRINYTDSETGANISRYNVEGTELRLNELYISIYVFWMKFLIVELLPYILILLLNSIMIVKIHSALRVQKQLTTNRPQSLEAQRKELNMALVLICIVVLFILCQSVKIVPDVYEALVCRRQQGVCHSRSAEEHARIERIVAVSNLMLAINSAFNFIIYMLRGDKFRRVLSRKLAQLFNRGSAGRGRVTSQFESPSNLPTVQMSATKRERIGGQSPRRVTRANTLHTDVFDATATKNGNNTTDNKDSRSPPGSRSGGNGGRGRSLRHLRFHESFRMTETVTVTQIQSFRMTDVKTSSDVNGGIAAV